MTPEEAEIIRDIFERVRRMGPSPRDPEALAALDREIRANPDAVMGLVRAVVALDRERCGLLDEIDALRGEIEAARREAGGGSGGGLFGGRDPRWGRPPAPAAGAPWNRDRGRGSLGSTLAGGALGGAVGLAGGLFGYEVVKSLFGGASEEAADRFGPDATSAVPEQLASSDRFETGGTMDDSGDFSHSIDDSFFS